MAVLQSNGIHAVVDSIEEKPLKKDATAQAIYTEKARIVCAVRATFVERGLASDTEC